jgi:hypothetical protein
MPDRSHSAAMMDAEVRLLEHSLSPWEVLTREQLARRVRAEHWRGSWFDRVLRTASERGAIEVLAQEFIALPVSERGRTSYQRAQ